MVKENLLLIQASHCQADHIVRMVAHCRTSNDLAVKLQAAKVAPMSIAPLVHEATAATATEATVGAGHSSMTMPPIQQCQRQAAEKDKRPKEDDSAALVPPPEAILHEPPGIIPAGLEGLSKNAQLM